MPQMAPMWWSTLFILFIMVFMMTYVINYFLTQYKPSTKMNFSKSKNFKNWTW